MEFGIYEKVPFDEYRAWPGVNSSLLGAFQKSPMHYRYFKDRTRAKTDALEFGDAVHCAVLEPERFERMYVGVDIPKRNTKVGKEAWAKILEENAGKNIIKLAEFEKIMAIREAISDHEAASEIMSIMESTEISIRFRYQGVECKGRIDGVCPEISSIVDLKTTQNATSSAFQKTIQRYAYYRQMAFYLLGLKELGLEYKKGLFIAVESSPPHGVSVFALDDLCVKLGQREIEELLEKILECEKNNSWPGYSPRVQSIQLSSYNMSDLIERYGEPDGKTDYSFS